MAEDDKCSTRAHLALRVAVCVLLSGVLAYPLVSLALSAGGIADVLAYYGREPWFLIGVLAVACASSLVIVLLGSDVGERCPRARKWVRLVVSVLGSLAVPVIVLIGLTDSDHDWQVLTVAVAFLFVGLAAGYWWYRLIERSATRRVARWERIAGAIVLAAALAGWALVYRWVARVAIP